MAPDPKTAARAGYAQRKLQGDELLKFQLNNANRRASVLAGELGAAHARLATLEVTREPLTYDGHNGNSFFRDIARSVRLRDPAAAGRLARHQREMDAELPRREEARARAAARAYEEAFSTTSRERRSLDAMTVPAFERRAQTRTPGQGGYFTPPMYLVDDYVGFARAAAVFASAWHEIDLPTGTSQINVPRLALGTGTGPQADATPAVSRDLQDSLVSASVRTVAGISDVSRQWYDQGQGASADFGTDRIIFADLAADLLENVDGQLLLGSGTGSQLLGVWPAGAIAAANGIVVADSNNATGQTWTTASTGTSLHTYAAQSVSLLRRLRAMADGLAWYWHPFAWSLWTAQTDTTGRPFVLGQDLAGLPDGAVGEYQNIPVYVDASIPTTFGGSVSAPYMNGVTAGQYAAQPGSGTGASYTPLLLARPGDLYLFAGGVRIQVFDEILAGTMGVRFQASQYLAAMPNRYVAASATGSNVSAGGDVAHSTVTWQQANSLLQLAGSGY
jgi:hypothetical protein